MAADARLKTVQTTKTFEFSQSKRLILALRSCMKQVSKSTTLPGWYKCVRRWLHRGAGVTVRIFPLCFHPFPLKFSEFQKANDFFFQMFGATAFSILRHIARHKYFIIASKAMTFKFKFKIIRRQIAETVVERFEQLQVATILATAWCKKKQKTATCL